MHITIWEILDLPQLLIIFLISSLLIYIDGNITNKIGRFFVNLVGAFFAGVLILGQSLSSIDSPSLPFYANIENIGYFIIFVLFAIGLAFDRRQETSISPKG